MAHVCDKCLKVHPPGMKDCKEAAETIRRCLEAFDSRVEEHKRTCRGCPNPDQHVINLDRLDNLREELMVPNHGV